MKRLLIVVMLILALFIGGCSDGPEAQRVLTQQGYTQIQITGVNFFSCGEGDIYRTGFTALTYTQQKVEGTVCSGVLKGNTIRLD